MLAIIQARMSSSRMPAKVLSLIQNKPMIFWTIKRLRLSNFINKIIVATSDDITDEPLVSFCHENNIEVYRGSLKSVATRLLDCATQNRAEYFIRISGDSPLIDPILVDEIITLFNNSPNADLYTNIFPRSYPKGQSVEIIRTSSLKSLLDKRLTDNDVEHVTQGFYKSPVSWKIINKHSGIDSFETIQSSVDTLEDFAIISQLIESIELEDLSWQRIALEIKKR